MRHQRTRAHSSPREKGREVGSAGADYGHVETRYSVENELDAGRCLDLIAFDLGGSTELEFEADVEGLGPHKDKIPVHIW